jgi:hypothetical protein
MITKAIHWIKISALRDLALPLVVYTVAIVFITWPLVAHLSTQIAGPEYADSLEYMRLGWWGKYALQNGLNPFQQSLFAYPQGFVSAIQIAQPLIYWPISMLGFVVNPTAAFNLWLMLEVLLSGLTAYWLCRDVLRDMPVNPATCASLIGGLIFIAFPAMQGHILGGHINPLANYAVPLVFLAALRIMEGRGTWRTAVFGAISLLVLMLGNFTAPAYVLLPLLITMLIGTNIKFIRHRQINWQIIEQYALMFGLGAILILPFYLPLAADFLSTAKPVYLQEGGRVTFSTDPLAFISVSAMTSWLEPLASDFSRHILLPNAIEGSAYLGIIACAFLFMGLWVYRRRAIFWVGLALLCMIFSLGPLLKFNNQLVVYNLADEVRSFVIMPYSLFQGLPFISGTRTAARFNMMTGLALGVAAAYGFVSILMRIEIIKLQQRFKHALPIALTALAAVLILAEYQVAFPFQITPTVVPDYFSRLASNTSVTGAVMELPFSDLVAQKEALLHQTYHHKPLIAGYVSRVTPVDPAQLDYLEGIATGVGIVSLTEAALTGANLRSVLRSNGVSVIVYRWIVWKDRRERLTKWATSQFGPPVFEGDWHTVFEVPNAEPSTPSASFVLGEEGWYRASESIWLTDSASIVVNAPSDNTYVFHLEVNPLLQPRPIQVSVDGTPTHIAQVQVQHESLDLPLMLSAGTHTIEFDSIEGCTLIPVQPVCMQSGNTTSSDAACKLPEGTSQLCIAVGFNNIAVQDNSAARLTQSGVVLSGNNIKLTLQGYHKPQTAQLGSTIAVQTLWQASGKTQSDYHVFVHVLDSEGKLAAQADSIPGEGNFPMAQWAADQSWLETSRIVLPAELKGGTYQVYVGWYSYPDLTRMSVASDKPHAQDGLVYLGELEVK